MADLKYAPGGVEDRDDLSHVANTPEAAKEEGKLLAKSLLYVAYGFLVSLIVGGIYSFLLSYYCTDQFGFLNDTGLYITIGVILVSAILQIFLIPAMARSISKGKSGIVVFSFYAVLEGLFLGSFLVVPGITYEVVLEALGFSFVIFLIAGVVGWFSKKMNWALSLGIMFLSAALLLSSFWLIIFFFAPEAFSLISCIVTICFVLAMVLFISFDCYRIRKIAQAGAEAKSIALYCGFTLYSDFMALFFRVLLIIASSKRNN